MKNIVIITPLKLFRSIITEEVNVFKALLSLTFCALYPYHAGFSVHITQSHTMESMSFTYERSSTSVSIATKPYSSRVFINSDSDSEEESASSVEVPSEPDSPGDIPTNHLVMECCCSSELSLLTLQAVEIKYSCVA